MPFYKYDTPSTYITVSVGLEPGHGLTGHCAVGSAHRLQSRCHPDYRHLRVQLERVHFQGHVLVVRVQFLMAS